MMSVIAKKRLSPKAEVFLLTHCLHEGKEQDSDSSLFPVQEYLEKKQTFTSWATDIDDVS